MVAKKGMIEEFSFAAEGLAGTAASAALRRTRSLADAAPAGRLFASIATLSDMSRKIEASLETGAKALTDGDEDQASVACARALLMMDKMATAAGREERAAASAAEPPKYLKKRGKRPGR